MSNSSPRRAKPKPSEKGSRPLTSNVKLLIRRFWLFFRRYLALSPEHMVGNPKSTTFSLGNISRQSHWLSASRLVQWLVFATSSLTLPSTISHRRTLWRIHHLLHLHQRPLSPWTQPTVGSRLTLRLRQFYRWHPLFSIRI